MQTASSTPHPALQRAPDARSGFDGFTRICPQAIAEQWFGPGLRIPYGSAGTRVGPNGEHARACLIQSRRRAGVDRAETVPATGDDRLPLLPLPERGIIEGETVRLRGFAGAT